MIKLFLMDVDGTLTDGKIYVGTSGEVMKAFNVKDGLGIVNLSKYNILPIIITGRISDIDTIRSKELGIKEVYQGVTNKKEKYYEILKKFNVKKEEVAYVGDDINDLEVMKECGFKACPNNAVKEVKEICDFISKFNGGDGAIREIIDFIKETQL